MLCCQVLAGNFYRCGHRATERRPPWTRASSAQQVRTLGALDHTPVKLIANPEVPRNKKNATRENSFPLWKMHCKEAIEEATDGEQKIYIKHCFRRIKLCVLPHAESLEKI
ncbi:hypothetical protein EVAR_9563_1 [Eumeta japonica]|uniref:Uncharacterized protein n=1 Tax=Eumeta variegata TaxID=151549 RepID=A0A4C1U431_EUMVA|nr:hypothetical protein EVAR_9563_1 [Eumeta japonica]